MKITKRESVFIYFKADAPKDRICKTCLKIYIENGK